MKHAQITEAMFIGSPKRPSEKYGKSLFSTQTTSRAGNLTLGDSEKLDLNIRQAMGKMYDKLMQIIAEPNTAFKAVLEPRMMVPIIKPIMVVK